MIKITMLTLTLFSTFLSASEINFDAQIEPLNPGFNHTICLNTRLRDSSIGHTKYLKAEALQTLAKLTAQLNTSNTQADPVFSRLHPADQVFYGNLIKSLKNNGRELYSFELDKQLNSAGTCENVDAVLVGIIENLK